MKKIVAGFVFACVLAGFSGCGGSSNAEDATKQMLSAMNDISGALESVKDKETAKAAAPKLEAAVARLQEVKKKAEGIKTTKAEDEKLQKEYMPKILEATTRMQTAGLNAGLKCGAEPTFMKAIEKMKNLK